MKIFCRKKEMRFGDARFPDGLLIKNHTTTVDDEIAARLVLEHPNLFSMRAFPTADRVATTYDPTGKASAETDDAPTEDEGSE